jgi:hypothetical protein
MIFKHYHIPQHRRCDISVEPWPNRFQSSVGAAYLPALSLSQHLRFHQTLALRLSRPVSALELPLWPCPFPRDGQSLLLLKPPFRKSIPTSRSCPMKITKDIQKNSRGAETIPEASQSRQFTSCKGTPLRTLK